jgi:hypothetical protein
MLEFALTSCGHTGANDYRRLVPIADLSRCSKLSDLLDHLVSAHEERLGDCEPDRFGGFEVDE